MRKRLDAYFCLGGAMILVGSGVAVGKVITQAFPLFLASSLRFAIAAAFLMPYVLKRGGGFGRLSKGAWLLLAGMAICGQVLFTLLLLWGLRMTGAMEAGLITSTTPAAMALMAFFILGERLSLRGALGVALAMGALLLVHLLGGLEADNATGQNAGAQRWLGNLLVSGAVLGEAVFLLIRKRLPADLPNLTVTAALCLLGLLFSLPLGIWQALDFDFAAVGPGGWASIFYFGLVFTVLAYFLWFRGVSQVSGGTAGVFTALMPVSALALTSLFLGERLTWLHLAAGLMVVAAILLISLAEKESGSATGEPGVLDAPEPIEVPAGMGRW